MIPKQLLIFLQPHQHPVVKVVWFGIILGTLPATALFIFYRANFNADQEFITKLVYAGPIPTIVIIWCYSRLRWQSWCFAPLTIIPDFIIFSLPLLRFLGYFPFSGHALFLSYLVLTAGRSRLALFASLILLVETVILKLTIYQDPYSLVWGILLMIPFAILFWILSRPDGKHLKAGPAASD